MKNNNTNKKNKAAKIIIFIVALTMIISTFATFFAGKGGKKDNTKQVTEESLKNDKNNNKSQPANNDKSKAAADNKANSQITDGLKKAMASAEVKVDKNKVISNIKVNEDVNKIQADKVVEEYLKSIKEKYKGKDIQINVISKGKNVTTSNVYDNIKQPSDATLPTMSLRIEPAITNMDRHVVVTLNTKTPEKYTVKVLGKACRYAKTKGFFHTVVTTTDEAAIKKGIQVVLNK
ncbi:hypothetical protein [Clostridium brassicae]|uniref:Uncharacterized protein n=1 Tax=Clostridium brassicae TaxID=2999072 RepID=A0ABT4DAP1_9CLOT|nr:hypothetical protein [Clostridium brassicae]MCY6959367.1 hypothetical protein [Clostridium brassicae]